MARNEYMAAQLDLFNQVSLNVLRDLKEAMALDAEASGLSREELCDRMNQIAERYGVRLVKGSGVHVTMATLEKWLNPEDRERVIPAKGLPIFCAATGGIRTMQALAAPLGWRVINERQARRLELAELEDDIKEKKARMRRLAAEF